MKIKSNGGIPAKKYRRKPGQIARQQRRLGTPRPERKPVWTVGGRRRVDPVLSLATAVAAVMKGQQNAPDPGSLDRFALEGMTVAELREKCDLFDIKTTTKLRKSQLIEMLVGR